MSSKRLFLVAFVSLLAANVVPAFRLAGDLMYGWQASILEFIALFGFGQLEHGQWPAAVLGVTANLAYLATLITVWIRRSRLTKRIAIVACASAFGSTLFLASGSEKFIPYPGCLLWLTTGVLLVVACTRGESMRAESGEQHSAKKRIIVRKRPTTRWIVSASAVVILMTLAGSWYLHVRRVQHEVQCIKDAEQVVADYLNANPLPDMGDFQHLSGEGYGGSSFSAAGYFLEAQRIAHFTNRSYAIRICVFPRHPTQPDEVHVYLVQDGDILVSHPSLIPP